MKSKAEWTCGCPKECNTLSYSFSVTSTPLDPNELCTKDVDTKMWQFYENKFPTDFVRTQMKVKYNVSDDATYYCKKNIKYRAEVNFKMATDSMEVTVLSRRLSFFDKMAAFGRCEYIIVVAVCNN